MNRHSRFSRATLLLILTSAAAVPLACGDRGQCAGPQGLCLQGPDASAGSAPLADGSTQGGASGSAGGTRSGTAGIANGAAGASGAAAAAGAVTAATGGATIGAGGNGGAAHGGAGPVTISFPSFGGAAGAGVAGANTAFAGGGATASAGAPPIISPPEWVTCPQPASVDDCLSSAGAADEQAKEPGAIYCGAELPPSVGGSEAPADPVGIGGIGAVVTLLDDFEHWGRFSNFVLGGRAAWSYAYKGNGTIVSPSSCMGSSPIDPGNPTGGHAMNFSGAFFLPGDYALIAAQLRTGEPSCDQPMDLSSQTGIRFRARATPQTTSGSAWIRVAVQTTTTSPSYELGTCTGVCSDAHGSAVLLTEQWADYMVPFSGLAQEGWGDPAIFHPETALGVIWIPLGARYASTAPCFDFSIDDVAFYRDE